MPDQEALDPNLLKTIFKKVGRKVCTIKYNGAIAKLTAKGSCSWLVGIHHYSSKTQHLQNSSIPLTLSTRMMRNLGIPRIQTVLDNMFLTPAGRESDDIQLSLRTIIEKTAPSLGTAQAHSVCYVPLIFM